MKPRYSEEEEDSESILGSDVKSEWPSLGLKVAPLNSWRQDTQSRMRKGTLETEYETISQSDLDLESIYMTGLEDLTGNETCKTKDEPTFETVGSSMEEICQTSSFIQNILYEDSRTGTAVVDLFVSVKTVKDDLDVLSRCNSQLLCKINYLRKETRIIKADYRNLLNMMLELSDKMNADHLIWNFPSFKPLNTAYILKDYRNPNGMECEEGLSQKELETSQGEHTLRHSWEESETESQTLYSGKIGRDSTKGKNHRRRFGNRCRKCKRNEPEEFESNTTCPVSGKDIKGKKTDGNDNCLGCFMSIFHEIPFHQLPILPEALLGSFLASFFWLIKEQEKTLKTLKSSKSLPPATLSLKKEGKCDESSGNVNLSESTIQMISDICENLSEAKDMPGFSLKKSKKTEKELDLENWVSCGNRLRGRYCSLSAKDIASGERVDLKPNFLRENLTLCSATVSPAGCPNSEKKPVEGNESSKVAVEAENDSSSEEGSDFVEALTGPLTSLPQNELKSLSVMGLGDLTAAVMGKKSVSTLTATNDTSWVGRLSDEVYKTEKKNSKADLQPIERSSDKSDKASNEIRAKYSENMQFTITANTPLGLYDMMIVQYKKNHFSDHIWSEDSFHNSDLEPVWTNSNSVAAENELEEFLEIYVKDSKKKNGKLVSPQEIGVLKKMELKTHKAHFFEIQKCFPVHFVQEMAQKTPVDVHSMEIEESRNGVDEEEISDCTEVKEKKQVIVEESSSDLVIYIQVEFEEGWSQKFSNAFVENQTSSLGTQTAEDSSGNNLMFSERVIKLNESSQSGTSFYQIWKGCRVSQSDDSGQEGSRTFSKPLMDDGGSNIKRKNEQAEKECYEDVSGKENSEIFDEELSKMYTENEINETYPDEEETEEKVESIVMGTAELLIMKEEKQRTDAWIFQPEVMHKLNIIVLQHALEVSPEIIEMININAIELKKALDLIHEIENDIINIKLNDAILILPQLEAELRKHLQSKIRNIGERDSELDISVDKFFSTVEFWPEEEETKQEEEAVEDREDNSQERLNNLLKLLSNLEEAVKSNERSSNKLVICQFGFSKIYELLHALILQIRELEEHPNVTSVSQTLEIASQLDTAVREYDNEVNKLNYGGSNKKKRKSKSLEEIPDKYHLKNVRKKVFEIVEEEACNLEEKIEADFDRLDRIEKENNEAMKFLETFLQKTERRMAERASLKNELKNLSSALNSLYEAYREAVTRRREKEIKTEKQILQIKKSSERSARTSSDELCPKDDSVKESLSGLFTALDRLKSRAREKNEVCKEILSSSNFEKAQDSEDSSRRSSKSSLPAKLTAGLKSFVRECKRIGSTSLYLSWTEPEGALKDFIVGYQIYVDGKLNQKVRNPQRLQAILYSVELTKKIQVQLYGLAENHSKILLTTLVYPIE